MAAARRGTSSTVPVRPVVEPLSVALTQSHEKQAQQALPTPVPRQPALTRLLALQANREPPPI